MAPGFYWIEIQDSTVGPEIARLFQDMFFTTRSDGNGETITVFNETHYVSVLGGPLEWLECRQPPCDIESNIQQARKGLEKLYDPKDYPEKRHE